MRLCNPAAPGRYANRCAGVALLLTSSSAAFAAPAEVPAVLGIPADFILLALAGWHPTPKRGGPVPAAPAAVAPAQTPETPSR